MKKKICFVGFDEKELEPLKPVLTRMAGAWDCVFFQDSAPALVSLGAAAVDALVASAGNGNLDGAEFMHQAATRHPRTLRLILGYVAEQELIISCIGATHQFIAKPCKPHDLVSAIQRSLALDACTSSDQIRAIAPKLRRLPSLPSTYFEVLKQVESASATVQSVGEVIMRDPALTARLLQMVNSAAFALAQKVTDPLDAVSLLGMETVKSLVLCLQVFAQNDAAKKSGISLDQLWNHSFTTAKLAREIALFETGNALLASEAFTAGLLHDVGRIVIASNLPKEYAETVKFAREQGRPLHLQESAQFGVDHAQVGAYLLGLWGLPAALVEAAALHHNPSRTPAHDFSLLTAVHVANVFAHEKEGDKSEFVQPELDPNYLNALGLAGKEEVWKQLLSGEAAEPQKAQPVAPVVPQTTEPKTTEPRTVARPAPVEVSLENTALFNFLLPAAAVITIVAGVFIWQYNYQTTDTASASANVASTPITATTAAPAPPIAPVVPVKPVVPISTSTPPQQVAQISKPDANPVSLDGFDSVKLEGILVGDTGSSVIFNGKTFNVGDRINGVLIESIDSAGVTAVYNGEQKFLKVK